MLDTIKAGTILIRQGTLFPQGVWFASKPFPPNWRLVENLDGHGLGRIIHEAGWHFFYLAGEITATAVGTFGSEKAWRAVKRILAMPAWKKFNSLQVTRVAQKRSLGLPYTRVTCHLRHIQESVFLFQSSRPAWDIS